MNPTRLRRKASRSASGIEVMAWSATLIVPEVGKSSAASRYSRVLLPDPDGPTMNVHDPVGSWNVTPRSASTTSSPLWKVLRTSIASIITASPPQGRGAWRDARLVLREITGVGSFFGE